MSPTDEPRDDDAPLADAPPPTPDIAASEDEEEGGLARRFRDTLRREPSMTEEQVDQRVSERVAHHWSLHWAQVREERREHQRETDAAEIRGGQSNFSRAHVPWGVDLAAAWAWRFLVIVAAGYVILWFLNRFQVVVLPLVVALFISALVIPMTHLISRVLPRGLSSLLTLLSVVGAIALMITFATRQVVDGAPGLSKQVVAGLDKIRTWLQEGPLQASDQQIDDAINRAQEAVTSSSAELVRRATEVGGTVADIVAGVFIALFATFFFLSDGQRIWAWVVRLFPRAARSRADASGRVAWLSLTQFVRATVLVAIVDAAGIMIVAAILKVPFVMAIGFLVFLGSFVPLVGATISGSVAVLVALVDQGPWAALLMLAGVIGVQQVEAHVLQPFLMGRMVSVHPLGVIVAVAMGVLTAGIAGALVAVPLAASLNAVVVYLSSGPREEEGDDSATERGPTTEVTPDPA